MSFPVGVNNRDVQQAAPSNGVQPVVSPRNMALANDLADVVSLLGVEILLRTLNQISAASRHFIPVSSAEASRFRRCPSTPSDEN